MEIRMYLRMLQKGWWLIALCLFSAAAASLTFSYLSVPIYLATARFVASPDASFSQGGDIINSINTLDKRSIVTTYSIVLTSNTIYNEAVDDLKTDPEVFAEYNRSVVVLPESNVLELFVEGPDPVLAANLTNSIGSQAIQYIDGLNQGFNIRILDPAQIPTEPIRPRPSRDLSLAIIFGLVLGSSLSLVREQLLAPIETFLKRNNVDPLSGVISREYFDRMLDEVITRSPLVGFHTLGLVHLKGLVDYLGVIPKPIKHRLFRQITKSMESELRGSDIVARWDSASFVVLLAGTPGDDAVVTMGRVQMVLSGPFFIGDSEVIYLDPRIGLAERLENESSDVLSENAKRALNQSISGNINLVLYKPDS